MAKVSKTYRISEEALSELGMLAADGKVSHTAALEAAIFSARHSAIQSNTLEMMRREREILEKQNALLLAQLDAKDGQISDLSSALVAAQETARAAQVLHAADKPAIAAREDGGDDAGDSPRKTRWARLVDAWRG